MNLKLPKLPSKLTTLPYVVIFFLLCVIAIDRCEGPAPKPKPVIIERVDTVWKERVVTVPAKPKPVTPGKVTPPKGGVLPQPSTDCDTLRKQYVSLRDSFYTKQTFEDTLKIDSLGYVKVTDTVHQNTIVGRQYSYNLRYPEVTKTITIREPSVPKRQLYVGGGVSARFPGLPDVQLEGGLLYKDKKDRLYGVNVATDFRGAPIYGVRTYWKIRLKK